MNEANKAYVYHLDCLLKYGEDAHARGLEFKETIGLVYQVPMSNPVVTNAAREMGYKFAVAEPFWILSGSNLLSEITEYGRMSPYSDEGYFMRGAYGPKIIDQLPYICETLAADLGSRQAVLTIWRERPAPSRDIPCTVSMQFIVRKGRLNCCVTMRSSDAIMGLPYDSILFSLTSAYVISIMRKHHGIDCIELGDLMLFIGSSHVYNNNYELAANIVACSVVDPADELDFNRLARLDPEQFMFSLETARMHRNGILHAGKAKL